MQAQKKGKTLVYTVSTSCQLNTQLENKSKAYLSTEVDMFPKIYFFSLQNKEDMMGKQGFEGSFYC